MPLDEFGAHVVGNGLTARVPQKNNHCGLIYDAPVSANVDRVAYKLRLRTLGSEGPLNEGLQEPCRLGVRLSRVKKGVAGRPSRPDHT